MKFSLSLLSAFLLIFLTSCDPCSDTECGTYGTCDDGTCFCEMGYEGLNCETKAIERFLGSWTANDFQCDDEQIGAVNLVIEEGNSIIDMVMYDVEDPEFRFHLQYTVNDLFLVEKEVDGTKVSGQGSLHENGTLSFVFEIEEDGEKNSCSGLFSK